MRSAPVRRESETCHAHKFATWTVERDDIGQNEYEVGAPKLRRILPATKGNQTSYT